MRAVNVMSFLLTCSSFHFYASNLKFLICLLQSTFGVMLERPFLCPDQINIHLNVHLSISESYCSILLLNRFGTVLVQVSMSVFLSLSPSCSLCVLLSLSLSVPKPLASQLALLVSLPDVSGLAAVWT